MLNPILTPFNVNVSIPYSVSTESFIGFLNFDFQLKNPDGTPYDFTQATAGIGQYFTNGQFVLPLLGQTNFPPDSVILEVGRFRSTTNIVPQANNLLNVLYGGNSSGQFDLQLGDGSIYVLLATGKWLLQYVA